MKLALLILYFGVMVGIGLYCRKHTSGINGFVLGGRSVGPWLTAFAYGTSYFSAVVFVGYAGQFGWKYGIAATWAGIGNAILGSLLAWAVLGRRTRILTQHYNSATMPQFFGQRFQSKSLKIGASVIVFVFLIPYTASLFNGLSRLFGMAFHMDYTVCIILMGVLTGIYVIAGGYMATAINDFIQGCVMLVGICVVIAAVLNTQGGFLEALHGLAAVSDPETVNGEVPGIFASFFGPDPVNLLGVVILTSLGTWGLPQMVQKFYAIKSEDSIHKGTIISTLFAVVVAGGCYFLGGFGRLFADQVDVASEGYDAIIPAMLSGLPDLLIAVVVILVLSASMSTLSSLVIASSSTLTIDLLKGNSDLDEIVNRWKTILPNAEIFPISAKEGFNTSSLMARIVELLPPSPPYFGKDALTDKPARFFVTEIIREKILLNYDKEIPYSVEVLVEKFEDKEHSIHIMATIYVERDSQKGILIGKAGSMLKKVGREARKDIETFFGKSVYLELFVKVEPNWRNRENKLKAFGYIE